MSAIADTNDGSGAGAGAAATAADATSAAGQPPLPPPAISTRARHNSASAAVPPRAARKHRKHGMCKLTFRVEAEVNLGETVAVAGDHMALGSFYQAVQLITTPDTYPIWTNRYPITVPMGLRLRYKCVLHSPSMPVRLHTLTAWFLRLCRYAVFTGGHLAYWENIGGDRSVAPTGPTCEIEDTFAIYTKTAPAAEATRKKIPLKRTLGSRTVGTGQVIFVMYDLPLFISKNEDGTWDVKWDEDNFKARSPHSIADSVGAKWVGVVTSRCFTEAGHLERLSDDEKESLRAHLVTMGAVPVFVDHSLRHMHEMYCSAVLWPNLHNVVEFSENEEFDVVTDIDSHLAAYTAVNQAVATAVASVLHKDDLVWIHGYELMLLPKLMVDTAGFRAHSTFWFHTPFPTSEIFRTLSSRDVLLQGVLATDMVGFHVFNHARHFMTCCKRLLGLEFKSRLGGRMGVSFEGREVMVTISHLALQTRQVYSHMKSPEAAGVAMQLLNKHRGKTIIGGIDRHCERLQGVFLKILAFQSLLQSGYAGKVVLVQRTMTLQRRTKDYVKSSREIRALVERINAQFGPVVDYEEAPSFSLSYRLGFYYAINMLLQTPIREGVNMLPLEFVYSRGKWESSRNHVPSSPRSSPLAGDSMASSPFRWETIDPSEDIVLPVPLPPPPMGGILVLSEFATASHCLSACSSVNPWNIPEVRALSACARARVCGSVWPCFCGSVRGGYVIWIRVLTLSCE